MKKAVARRLVNLMGNEADRAVREIRRPKGHPAPYYASFLVRDEEQWRLQARYGTLSRNSHSRQRQCRCDVRVGSYKYDQVREGGLEDHSSDDESYGYINIPFEGADDGVRYGLWRLADVCYREAVEDYGERRASELTFLDRNREYVSFEKRDAAESIHWSTLQELDQDYWQSYIKKASLSVKKHRCIKISNVKLELLNQVRLFAATDGSRVVQSKSFWTLSCYLWLLSAKGDAVETTVHHFVNNPKELPELASFKREIKQAVTRLEQLAAAPRLRSYAGPVLLDPLPAGLLIHEAVGHRLEGNRMLSSGEGQTYRDMIGKKVLPTYLSLIDNPKQQFFEGRTLVGHYDYDDEGSLAQDAQLIDRGILRGFLTSRAAIGKKHQSNGHARTQRHQRPISRMGVTQLVSHDGLDDASLKVQLIEEIKRQDLPFGIRILQANGGETATESYNFQAFLGEIQLAAKVFPDGREELVRGVDFVGTPLNATRSIIAAGNRYEMDNAYCGAESGWVPVSTISPALLLSHLELQSKSDSPYTQYFYPMPWE